MRWRHLGFLGLIGGLLMHCGSSDPGGDTWSPDPSDGGSDSSKDGGHKKDGAPTTGDDDSGPTGDDDSGPTGDDDSGPTGDDDSGPVVGTPAACLPKHTDNVAASIDPPGGLKANQVPQF